MTGRDIFRIPSIDYIMLPYGQTYLIRQIILERAQKRVMQDLELAFYLMVLG